MGNYCLEVFLQGLLNSSSYDDILESNFNSENLAFLSEIYNWSVYIDENNSPCDLNFNSVNEAFVSIIVKFEDESSWLFGISIENDELIVDFAAQLSEDEKEFQGIVDWNKILDVIDNLK